jgi:hypothetical protein
VNHRIQRIAAIIAQSAIEVSNSDEVVNKVLESGELTSEEIIELKQALRDHAEHMADVAELHELCLAREQDGTLL